MCKECVSEGRLTQAELDQAIQAGDTSIIPMAELSATDFTSAVARLVASEMRQGMSASEAISIVEDFADQYIFHRYASGKPLTEAEVDHLHTAEAARSTAP